MAERRKAGELATMISPSTIPQGLELDHLCRNRACVNPNHLEPVTHSENARRGSNAKLKAHQVLEIRKVYMNSGTPKKQLARMYGVSDTTIRKILNREKWADLS